MNRRHLLALASAAAAVTLTVAGCSSSDTSDAGAATPEADASSAEASSAAPEDSVPEVAVDPTMGLDSVTGEEWLTSITDAEATFFDSAGDQALSVVINVTDTQQGTVSADTTYNPDDTFVATSTMTTLDGTESTMDVACTVDLCYQRADGGEWTEADRSLVERPVPGAIAAALQDLESSGTVTHGMGGGTFAVAVDIPEAEGQPAGTASLTETITETEMVTAMVVNVGAESSTTSSTMTVGDPVALPDDLP